MIYYTGNLYYGSAGDGKIHIISASSGKTVKAFYSPGDHKPATPDAGFMMLLLLIR